MIFLTILRVTGIVLACIVGLLLLILLLVLFTPFRYSISAAGGGSDITGGAKIKWLLGLVTVRAGYAEKKAGYTVKAAGIKILNGTILDFGKDKDAAEDADGSSSAESSSGTGKSCGSAESSSGAEGSSGSGKNGSTAKGSSENAGSRRGDNREKAKTVKACDAGDKQSSTGSRRGEKTGERVKPDENSTAEGNPDTAENKQSSTGSRRSEKKDSGDASGRAAEKGRILAKKRQSPVQRIKDVWARIKHIYELVQKARYFLGAPVTKRALTKLGRFLSGFFKHIRPRKIRGYLKFGMEDPAATAQVYGIGANVAAMIDKRFMIIPDMDGKCFDIDILITGRIFVGYVLISALRVIVNKDVRRVIGYIRRNF